MYICLNVSKGTSWPPTKAKCSH